MIKTNDIVRALCYFDGFPSFFPPFKEVPDRPHGRHSQVSRCQDVKKSVVRSQEIPEIACEMEPRIKESEGYIQQLLRPYMPKRKCAWFRHRDKVRVILFEPFKILNGKGKRFSLQLPRQTKNAKYSSCFFRTPSICQNVSACDSKKIVTLIFRASNSTFKKIIPRAEKL